MPNQKKQPTKFFQPQRECLQWFLLDAEGKTLGRLASEIAKILRGKHSPQYTPNSDMGGGVIVVNADKVHVSGNKEAAKVYRHHSGYLGGLKEIPYRRVMERHPTRILEHAVSGMMPKTKLGRAMKKKLRIFAGAEHNLQAQQPIKVEI